MRPETRQIFNLLRKWKKSEKVNIGLFQKQQHYLGGSGDDRSGSGEGPHHGDGVYRDGQTSQHPSRGSQPCDTPSR